MSRRSFPPRADDHADRSGRPGIDGSSPGPGSAGRHRAGVPGEREAERSTRGRCSAAGGAACRLLAEPERAHAGQLPSGTEGAGRQRYARGNAGQVRPGIATSSPLRTARCPALARHRALAAQTHHAASRTDEVARAPRCPTCNRDRREALDTRRRPFRSQRCKQVDLGVRLNESTGSRRGKQDEAEDPPPGEVPSET